jgi:pimeloyl-ACP methyl ester carboxylesterase
VTVRSYGRAGPRVLVLHGGPGAPGYVAPLARALAGHFGVLEPFQRRSGGEPLTVARHVEDLDELIRSHRAGMRPALVGSSWGAMLALAYAAAHPEEAGPLVLVGCGTFDWSSRTEMYKRLDARMDEALRAQFARLARDVADPDQRFARQGDLLLPLYSSDPVTLDQELETCDERGYRETWADMLRLQRQGVYPAAFATIRSPVLMLHGAADPHPGALIRDSLAPFLPQLRYREWERCGHYPWMERAVREEFFVVLRDWLVKHLDPA